MLENPDYKIEHEKISFDRYKSQEVNRFTFTSLANNKKDFRKSITDFFNTIMDDLGEGVFTNYLAFRSHLNALDDLMDDEVEEVNWVLCECGNKYTLYIKNNRKAMNIKLMF